MTDDDIRRKKYRHDYYVKRREAALAYQKKYDAEHKEQRKAYHREYDQRRKLAKAQEKEKTS